MVDKEEKKEFEDLDKSGEVDIKDYKEALKVLGPEEKLKFIASIPFKKGEGKSIFILTNTRVLIKRKGESSLLGDREGVQDIPYERIAEINSEERKNYDLIIIKTKEDKEREFMAPKREGGKIAGRIRSLEFEKGSKEEREEVKEEKLEQIEKLSELKEKGAITKEEFEEKKKKILEEI